ncbi:arsenate reductase family protein [Sulfurimonas sp. MAG313]|nr:arsenate reductase family protein [Sulfurimonas sp. MAG313]MDF1881359.1 arsenate reductase family protein [Sulfurimonas sp. MAG313]
MVHVYGIKNCDSVKKAIKFLKSNEIPYTLHDFKTDSVPLKKISSWLKSVEMKQLFNTRGTTYRTLKLKELDLNDEQKLQWLAKENMLIKRPVIEYSANKVLCAFNEDIYKKELL